MINHCGSRLSLDCASAFLERIHGTGIYVGVSLRLKGPQHGERGATRYLVETIADRVADAALPSTSRAAAMPARDKD